MSATREAIAKAAHAARAACDKQASDIVVIDVSSRMVITDCFVVCSAESDRQVNAVVDEIEEKLREQGHKPARREGTRDSRWVLLDYVDIVVHVQHVEERDYYGLDRLWADCPTYDVPGATKERTDVDGDGASDSAELSGEHPLSEEEYLDAMGRDELTDQEKAELAEMGITEDELDAFDLPEDLPDDRTDHR